MFNLTKYAHEHRFRIRNVNDGHSVPPVRRVARGTIGAAGLERDDVIACRYGYVGDYGPGKEGWYLTSPKETAHAILSKVPQLEAIGAVVTQEGDYEAAGWAPESRIDDVLMVLQVCKLPPGQSAEQMERVRAVSPCAGDAMRPESTQRRRVGERYPRNRNRGVSRFSAWPLGNLGASGFGSQEGAEPQGWFARADRTTGIGFPKSMHTQNGSLLCRASKFENGLVPSIRTWR